MTAGDDLVQLDGNPHVGTECLPYCFLHMRLMVFLEKVYLTVHFRMSEEVQDHVMVIGQEIIELNHVMCLYGGYQLGSCIDIPRVLEPGFGVK